MVLQQTKASFQNRCLVYNPKLDMFVLAAMPILNIYKSPISIFPIGNLLAVILILKYYISGNHFTKIFNLPPYYALFWIWCTLSYAYTTMSISAIVPGGISFFIFTVIFCYMTTVFDMKSFRLCYRIIFGVCSAFFFIQFYSILRTDTFTPALIPWLKLADGTGTSDLIYSQQHLGRACSLFREPAHFAQYILPLLAIELFYDQKNNKIISPFAVCPIIVLLLLRSGNGLVGLALLLLVKLYQIAVQSNFKTKLISILFAIPLMAYSANYYVQSTIGEEMVARTIELENDQSAHSWARVWRGYYIYGSLPTINKLLGASDDQILSYMPSHLRLLNSSQNLYVNGVQQILISKGLIGLLIFSIMLVSWIKKGEILSKAALICFIGLCFVAQLYLTDVMLLSFVIATYLNKHNNTIRCTK